MRVQCDVDEVNIANESGREVASALVSCGNCGHEAWAYGTGENSVKRSLASLREECPKGENNYYEVD